MENLMNKDQKDQTMPKHWKIEGEAFERVKAAHKEAVLAMIELYRVLQEKRKAMWDIIHDALPESKREGHNYEIDTDNESLGFYIVKENGGCCDDAAGEFLDAILASAAKSKEKGS